jgi:hypothetical protein
LKEKISLRIQLYFLCLISAIFRTITFFTHPNTPSNFGPDEGTYAYLTEWISDSNSADEFPDFGGTLYRSARVFILPAVAFHRIGLSPLDSIRIVSSLYGLMALLLLVEAFLRLLPATTHSSRLLQSNKSLILTIFIVFAFLPSHFIWSTIGLRESSVEFWVLFTFLIVFWVFQVNKKLSFFAAILVLIAIVGVFNSRPQVGWVLGLTLSFYSLWRIRTPIGFGFLILTITGVFIGQATNINVRLESYYFCKVGK